MWLSTTLMETSVFHKLPDEAFTFTHFVVGWPDAVYLIAPDMRESTRRPCVTLPSTYGW